MWHRVTRRNEPNYLGAFGLVALGAVVGAGAALMFAPKSGTELRHDLQSKARQLGAGAQERIEKYRSHKQEPVVGNTGPL
jgi:gas vesicle protein